jgi:hypothetical protein
MTTKATEFCEEFLLRATRYTSNYGENKLLSIGSHKFQLNCNKKSYFGSLIFDSFIECKNSNAEGNFAIHVWDSSFPDILPDFTWAEEYIFSNHVIPTEVTAPYRVLFDRGQGMISVLNLESGLGGIWMRDHSQLDPRCFVSPFRTIISWIADTFNAEIVHASGIDIEGKGILISGPSGSGKSSLSIYAAQNGFGILSDDAVLFDNGILYPIYSRAKVETDNRFISFEKLKTFELENSPSGKRILPLSEFGENFIHEVKMNSFVFPHISGRSSIRNLTVSEGSTYLMEHSLRELFGGLPSNSIRLALMLKRYPKYAIELSGDIEADLELILRELSNGNT